MINRLNQLASEYEDLLRVRKADRYNSPVNVNEEKQHFLELFSKGNVYNPQFKYRDTPENWLDPFIAFRNRLIPNNFWEKLLYDDANQILDEMESIGEHSPEKITSETIWSHGIPSQMLINSAEEILEQPTTDPIEEKTISAKDAAQTLQSALEKTKLTEWQVEVSSEMNAKMMVNSSEKRVYVREGTMFAPENIKRLLVHEIGTHVFRYINGEKQNFKFLRMGFLGYLPTEEGLATYHEKKFNVQDKPTLRRYALRVLAASNVLSSSFYETFSCLAKYTNDFDDLFDIVKRAKRGFCDTKQRGGHLKDQVYLKGFMQVSDHLANNSNDYMYLMAGKVSLGMLPHLKNMAGNKSLIMPEFLPQYLI